MMALPHTKAAIKQTVGHVSKMGAKIKAGLNDIHAPSMATAGGPNISQNFFKDSHSGNNSSTHHPIDPTTRNPSNFAKEARLNATDKSNPQAFNSKNNPGEIISGKIYERSSISDHELQGYYNPLAAEAMVKSNHPEAVSKTIAGRGKEFPNAKLAGTTHPKTGVPFNTRGFADFDAHKVADVRIDLKAIKKEDVKKSSIHMKYATLELKTAIDKGFVDKSNFTSKQLKQIENGNIRIDGLTWHHHEDIGRMQLVPRDLHNKTNHAGGMKMWFIDEELIKQDSYINIHSNDTSIEGIGKTTSSFLLKK